ncbi:MAG: sigma-70 family RNA polymerase sigma factor [Planctomycetaceae bacterium]
MSISEVSASEPNERLGVLLKKAKEGSNSSLGELLIAYRDYLLAIADEELGSDLKVKVSASDVIQDSFLEAKRDFLHFAGKTPSEFQWWLRRVLLNNVANANRSYRTTAKRDVSREVPVALVNPFDRDGALVAGDATASSIVQKNELLDRVQAAVQRLPQHYQDVIRWRNLERIPFDEIGRRLERSSAAAQQLWVRALDALQQELDSGDETTPSRANHTT